MEKIVPCDHKKTALRDFSDDTDYYIIDQETQVWKRLYHVIMAIEGDKQLIAFNFTSIGYFLNDAYVKLMDHC